jgi:glycosyltransferase involved in cell wall biosynthesis
MAQLATAVVSNSAGGDAYWAARLRKGVRRFVIPNALPLDEIDATPAATAGEMGMATGVPVVLFAGRFGPEKNLQTLLPALDRVRARQPVQILCCGEGSLRPDVETWAASARAAGTRVVVTGYAHDLWAFMKGASMLVSPSLFEGSPNVVLEAMACGVPLVVSDIPQHRELLDESSALLVPPDAVEALAAAIGDVLRAPADAAARAQVARQRASRYSLSMVSRQYSDVYKQLLSIEAGR